MNYIRCWRDQLNLPTPYVNNNDFRVWPPLNSNSLLLSVSKTVIHLNFLLKVTIALSIANLVMFLITINALIAVLKKKQKIRDSKTKLIH
jgi:hypothetical protein